MAHHTNANSRTSPSLAHSTPAHQTCKHSLKKPFVEDKEEKQKTHQDCCMELLIASHARILSPHHRRPQHPTATTVVTTTVLDHTLHPKHNTYTLTQAHTLGCLPTRTTRVVTHHHCMHLCAQSAVLSIAACACNPLKCDSVYSMMVVKWWRYGGMQREAVHTRMGIVVFVMVVVVHSPTTQRVHNNQTNTENKKTISSGMWGCGYIVDTTPPPL